MTLVSGRDRPTVRTNTGLSIELVTPAPRGTRYGNRVTALRWARLLRQLGHRVHISTSYEGRPCDLMIGLHAKRSSSSMRVFKERHPHLPLVLCLTGTDLYGDIQTDEDAQRSMELADRLVVLHEMAHLDLPERLRPKVVPIIQSATKTPHTPHRKRTFDVCVIGHLREVKDPFRAAQAARLLPMASRIHVLHVGSAMTPAMERQARREMERNPRYTWLEELPAWRTRRVMKRSRILVISSLLEGGANVVCEALADGIPVLGSRIAGNIGLLGQDYPGYYETADTQDLARLLDQAETDGAYLADLQRHVAARAHLVTPEHERASWNALLQSISLRG